MVMVKVGIMKEKLIKKFYHRFFSSCIISTICVVIFTILIIYSIYNDEKFLVRFFLVSFLIFFLIIIFLELRKCVLDLLAIKNGDFKIITGIVIKIKEVDEGGDVTVIHHYPIVRDDETGQEIKLDAQGCLKGCRYTFLYLKHTKLAVVIEDISNMTSIQSLKKGNTKREF